MQHSAAALQRHSVCSFPEYDLCQSYTGDWEMAAQRAPQLEKSEAARRNVIIQNWILQLVCI